MALPPARAPRALIALCVSVASLLALVVAASPASAATTSLTSPTTLTGNTTLSSLNLTSVPILGVTTTATLDTTMNWTQPAAVLGTAFDPNLVRQGRALDPSDSFTRTLPGSMGMSWTLKNISISWDGIGPVNIGSVSMSANGGCDLKAGGPDYLCHLESGQISIADTSPAPGPYVKAKLVADVTVTPEGITTLRTATFGGNPDGTANLSLGESPVTDGLSIPCTVGTGDELNYALGSLSTTPGVSVQTNLQLDVGISIPNPAFPFPDPFDPVIYLPAFASPQYPLDTTTSAITMTGAGATFDMGAVQHNNIPPVVNAGGPYAGTEGTPIAFDGSASSSICGFPTLRWDFSDGGVAFGAHPQHKFADDGTYSGLLTATDATGLTSNTTFSVLVDNVAPAVNAGPDTTADWGRPVAFNGQATDPGANDQSTLQYSWDFGDGTPSASGGPSVLHAYANPGASGFYDATLTVCDKDTACTNDVRRVFVTKRDTTTAYLGDTAGTFATPASLGASLVDEYGQNVNSRTIVFQVGTDGPFNALTNSSGIATKSYTPTLAAGSYSGSSAFAGDALYNSSSSSNSFAVAKKATSTTYTGAVSGGPNKSVVLSAVLQDATGTPLASRTINFQLGAQSVSATTNASGVASTSLKLNQHNGTYTVSATWTPSPADGSFYLGSAQSAVFKLQAK